MIKKLVKQNIVKQDIIKFNIIKTNKIRYHGLSTFEVNKNALSKLSDTDINKNIDKANTQLDSKMTNTEVPKNKYKDLLGNIAGFMIIFGILFILINGTWFLIKEFQWTTSTPLAAIMVGLILGLIAQLI